MHPKAKGELTEQKVITRLMELGYKISKPIGDNLPYDIILDKNKQLIRCQIKTGKRKNGIIRFNSCKCRINTKGSYRTYYVNLMDYFIIYCYENNNFYMIKNPNRKVKDMSLMDRISKSGQKKNIKFAKNFLLEKVIKSI